MNKYKFSLGACVLGMMMVSCNDVLDQPNKSAMETDAVYTDISKANYALAGVIYSLCETNAYRGRFIPYFGTNTDCEIFNNYGGVAAPATDKEASLAVYSAKVDNTYMNTDNNAWAKIYEAIERCNLGIKGIEDAGNIDNDADMAQVYGEFITLRSMLYFDLVKAWGDVPARFEPLTSATMYIPKTDRVTLLKHVLDDLLMAEQYLGWPGENTNASSTEHASKSFAKGLRARVALFLAGKSQWPVAGSNTDSELRYNLQDESERQEMYTIARDECKSVIESGKNSLYATFDGNFRALCQETTAAGKESIYEIPFDKTRGRVLYTWGGKHSTTDKWTSLAKGGVNGPTPTLWYDYDKDDTRRNVTCLPYIWKDGKKTVTNTSGGGWNFGKLRFEWMSRLVTSTNDDGVNWQVMRYADILLMAAEAENQLNGPTADAQKWLKAVVDRAYQTATDKADAIIAKAALSKDNFQLVIEDERKFEFAGEALRKVDLMRWGKLTEKLAETKAKMTALANRTTTADGMWDYSQYANKIYYADGLSADANDADGYTIYGLEKGFTDDDGKELKNAGTTTNSSNMFVLTGDSENDNKVNAFIDRLYLEDPNSHMFWPIWKYFIDSSNGTLVNDYGY